jgi:hypothetical protein
MIYLYGAILKVQESMPEIVHETEDASILCDGIESRTGNLSQQISQFISNICESVEYCLHPCRMLVGTTFILLPLLTAKQHLAHTNTDELRWCSRVLDNLVESGLGYSLKIWKNRNP